MESEVLRRAAGTVKLAARMALKGGQKSALTFVSAFRPWCDSPRQVYRAVKPGTPGHRSVEVIMDTPCRKCEKCLTYKRLNWRARALTEIALTAAAGRRTWMVTLTFSAHHLAGVLTTAKTPDPRDVEARAYRECQRYFKRLRKAGHRMRYLAVYERGEVTGRSHYHLLLHELGPKPISKVEIERWWPSFVHARLVGAEDGAGSYVTKYLTKSSAARARSSARYGSTEGKLSERDTPLTGVLFFPNERTHLTKGA